MIDCTLADKKCIMTKDPIKKAANGTYYFRAKSIVIFRQFIEETYPPWYKTELTDILHYESATESIANYTSNQHTAKYHRTVKTEKCNP